MFPPQMGTPVVATVIPLEPLAVTEQEAARLLALCAKTVSKLPASAVGRFRVGRSVRYLVSAIKGYAEKLAAEEAAKEQR